MPLFFKIYSGFWAIMFLLFALLQINDPDPWFWIPAYFFPAVICGLAVFDRFSFRVTWGIVIVAVIGAVFYYPGSIADWISQEWEQKDLAMKTPFMEESREALGLFIVAAVLSFEAFFKKRYEK